MSRQLDSALENNLSFVSSFERFKSAQKEGLEKSNDILKQKTTPENELKGASGAKSKEKLGLKEVALDASQIPILLVDHNAELEHNLNEGEEDGLKDNDNNKQDRVGSKSLDHAVKTGSAELEKSPRKSFLSMKKISEKTQEMWSKLTHHRRRSSLHADGKLITDRQINYVSDLSNDIFEEDKIKRESVNPTKTKSVRQASKKGGSERLKKLLAKHVLKKRDVQAEFYLMVMVKKRIRFFWTFNLIHSRKKSELAGEDAWEFQVNFI